MKIENIAVKTTGKFYGSHRDFLITLRNMKIGQSVVVGKVDAYQRILLRAARILLEREYVVQREGKQYRIGRIE